MTIKERARQAKDKQRQIMTFRQTNEQTERFAERKSAL